MLYLSKTNFVYQFYKILVIKPTTEVKAESIGVSSVKEIELKRQMWSYPGRRWGSCPVKKLRWVVTSSYPSPILTYCTGMYANCTSQYWRSRQDRLFFPVKCKWSYLYFAPIFVHCLSVLSLFSLDLPSV
jgi:hypothetical protein